MSALPGGDGKKNGGVSLFLKHCVAATSFGAKTAKVIDVV